MNLTTNRISTLKLDGAADRIWFDDSVPGFGYRLRQSGAASWVYQYKLGRKTRRLSIGNANAIKPARAREIASELHAKVRLGGDPLGDKRLKIDRASHTLGALAAKYIDHQRDQLRPSSLIEVRRHLEQYALPLHALPIDSIDRRTISDRLNAIAKASGSVTANRVRATLSAMFAWGVCEGLVTANPIIGTNRRPEASRDRVLTKDELQLIWRALDDSHYRRIVKLLILTGQRLNEIAGLRPAEIGPDVITLPAERTKNKRAHEIPITPKMRPLLAASGDHVFGRRGRFSGFSKCKATLDKRVTELNAGAPLAPWTHHDLRRSVATGMADLGVQPHVVEALLNHVSGHKAGVAGIYNRSQYSEEKRAALELWGRHVAA